MERLAVPLSESGDGEKGEILSKSFGGNAFVIDPSSGRETRGVRPSSGLDLGLFVVNSDPGGLTDDAPFAAALELEEGFSSVVSGVFRAASDGEEIKE